VLVAVLLTTACGGGDDGSSAAPTTTDSTVNTTSSTTTTTVAPRTVALGETFSLSVGQSVTVAGEGLTVTYVELLSESRCRPGQQCLTAGEATISVTASKQGMAPATLTLGSAPTPPRYAGFRVQLENLSFSRPPAARLRVTKT